LHEHKSKNRRHPTACSSGISCWQGRGGDTGRVSHGDSKFTTLHSFIAIPRGFASHRIIRQGPPLSAHGFVSQTQFHLLPWPRFGKFPRSTTMNGGMKMNRSTVEFVFTFMGNGHNMPGIYRKTFWSSAKAAKPSGLERKLLRYLLPF